MEIMKGGTPSETMLAMLFADLSVWEMDTQRDFLLLLLCLAKSNNDNREFTWTHSCCTLSVTRMTIATTTRGLRHRHWVRCIVVDFADRQRRQRRRQSRRHGKGQRRRHSRKISRVWQVQHEISGSFWFLLTKCSWWAQATPIARKKGGTSVV